MREIKFRAWDEQTKTMVYPSLDLGFTSADILKQYSVVLQYTTFDAANCTELYDGDILKDSFNRILLVEWHKGRHMFKAVTETNFGWADIVQWFEGEIDLPIVIGNIYENPELLESIDVREKLLEPIATREEETEEEYRQQNDLGGWSDYLQGGE